MELPTADVSLAILAFYLGASVGAAIVARRRGLPGLGVFLLSLLFTPLFGLLAATLLRPR